MNMINRLWIILSILVFCACNSSDTFPLAKDTNPDPTSPTENPALLKIKGNSIQIDPTVLYAENISPQELVADLKMANMKSVHFFIAGSWDGTKDDNLLRPEYLNELENNGISVWVMLLGNCVYGSSSLPKEWEMECLTPYPSSGIKFYSFHNDDFVAWQVERVKNIMSNYDFVGIEFAESYFPEWKTINSNGFYGDVSEFARRKFTVDYVGQASPILTFDEIRNDPALYQKWIDFRSDAIIDFNHAIKKAIKDINPETLYAAWGMGMRKGTMDEIKEHFGLDMTRMVKEVKPDVMVIQTSSQDWGDASLEPNYIKDYNTIVQTLQIANPNVALSIQADIVSLGYHNQNLKKRDPEWWLSFCDLSLKSGYYTNTAYEYAFAKKDGIWMKGNLENAKPQKLYKDASLSSTVIADDVLPLGLVKEKDNNWKMVYTEHGLGWFYVE